MIFGIKTKKDKRIEKLQKEINNLKFQLLEIFTQSISVSTISASYVLDKLHKSIVPESSIKGILANMLVEEIIKRQLPIEKIKMDDDNVEYRVRLEVILDDIYRN